MTFRSDFAVREIPAPATLAPDAFAVAGDVRPGEAGADSEFGTGRFVLLHDPAEPDAWDGAWRIVCFAQAPLEPEIGTDPLLPPPLRPPGWPGERLRAVYAAYVAELAARALG